MDAVRKEIYTTDDIDALPDGIRAELVDGNIYYMSAPSRTHQKIIHFFDMTIGNFIKENNGKCEIYPAPFAVYLKKDKKNYVEPDLSVICDPSKLDEKGCHGAPDWIIEIVSPASMTMDYFIKFVKYREAGVREYWIVDPDKNRVTVYVYETWKMQEYSLTDEIPVGIFEGLTIKISD